MSASEITVSTQQVNRFVRAGINKLLTGLARYKDWDEICKIPINNPGVSDESICIQANCICELYETITSVRTSCAEQNSKHLLGICNDLISDIHTLFGHFKTLSEEAKTMTVKPDGISPTSFWSGLTESLYPTRVSQSNQLIDGLMKFNALVCKDDCRLTGEHREAVSSSDALRDAKMRISESRFINFS